MENLQKLKELVGLIGIDQLKVNAGNKAAAGRVRKNLQEIKRLVPVYRADVLKQSKGE